MACDFVELAVDGVRRLKPYEPGKPIEELERELGIRDTIKLASNENPLGPSPRAIEAIRDHSDGVAVYPDGNGFALKAALAQRLGVGPECVTLGNGSNDVLEMVARAFVSPSDEVLFSEHAFAVYPIVPQAIGAKAVTAPAKDFGHDLAKMAELISEKTKLIFIANPNNPTGTYLDLAELEQFITNVPTTTLVVLDEAYVEYGEQSINTIDWLAKYDNLIITRTFSKAYGLAGLRIGYALSNVEVADLLNRIRQPFNGNSLALAAAEVALNDDDYLIKTKQLNDAGMQQLQAGFDELGLAYISSKGNFICVDTQQNGGEVFEKLLQQGVIVRPVGNYGLPNYLRVSIGLAEENQRFLDVLPTVLGIDT